MPAVIARTARMTPTARPAVAPLERPEDEDSAVGVSEGAVSAAVELSAGDEEVTAGLPVGVLLSWVDVVDTLDVLVEESSLPTAGGPTVLPSNAWAACFIWSAVSPESPEMLKRFE